MEEPLPLEPEARTIRADWVAFCVIILMWPLALWLDYYANLGMLKAIIITIAVMCLFSLLLLYVMNREAEKAKRSNAAVIGIIVVISSLTFFSFFFFRLYRALEPHHRYYHDWGWFPESRYFAIYFSSLEAAILSCVIIIFFGLSAFLFDN